MRIAVISDVHGNRFALEAVLEDVREQRVDAIANLGDQIFGAADPAGAYALQRHLGATEVRGNTEELFTAPLAELEGARREVEWLREQLPAESMEHLANLPLMAGLADGEVLLMHGSPASAWDALMFARDQHAVRDRVAHPQELLERVNDQGGTRVVLVGHTHQELIRAWGGVTFVNVGAVSRQMHGDPAARWTLLERRRTQWNVAFRRVEYDWDGAADWVLRHSPFRDQAQQLRTGRVS